VREIHGIVTKEAVSKEDNDAALHEIRHEAAMATLESVSREAATIAVRELRHTTTMRKEAATRDAAINL
jgi:ATP-dependent 26S proteasome regulatory subunit